MALLLAVGTGESYAHSPIKGLNHFYNGLLHPLLVPAHLLLLIAAGLLVGQRGLKQNEMSLYGFLLAASFGLVATRLATPIFVFAGGLERVLLTCTALTGVLVALRAPLPRAACLLLGVIVGLLIGLDSAQEVLVGRDGVVALMGTALGLNLLFWYPLCISDALRDTSWPQIGVRVAGSWLAASALLVLALRTTQA